MPRCTTYHATNQRNNLTMEARPYWETQKTRHVTPRKPRVKPEQQKCRACGEVKPSSEFHASIKHVSGINTMCKPCRSEYASIKSRLRKKPGYYRKVGEDHHTSKLTNNDVRMIKQLIADKEYHYEQWRRLTYAIIGEKFDVTASTIEAIANGKNWKHIA